MPVTCTAQPNFTLLYPVDSGEKITVPIAGDVEYCHIPDGVLGINRLDFSCIVPRQEHITKCRRYFAFLAVLKRERMWEEGGALCIENGRHNNNARFDGACRCIVVQDPAAYVDVGYAGARNLGTADKEKIVLLFCETFAINVRTNVTVKCGFTESCK